MSGDAVYKGVTIEKYGNDNSADDRGFKKAGGFRAVHEGENQSADIHSEQKECAGKGEDTFEFHRKTTFHKILSYYIIQILYLKGAGKAKFFEI